MQATVMRAAISLSTSEKPSFHSLKLVPISMPTLRRAHDAFVALQVKSSGFEKLQVTTDCCESRASVGVAAHISILPSAPLKLIKIPRQKYY